MTDVTRSGWRDEYLRRVAYALAPEHAEHGFRAEPVLAGADGDGCETCGGDGWVDISVHGDCPCGARAYGSVSGIEDTLAFMRLITSDPTANDAGVVSGA